jgi:glycosyltransferase involved in cell wall biosynthesis
MPRVTIIIPACDAAPFVAETLASVLAQTYRDLEVVVVDDGSRDATAAVVDAVATTDPRVRLIRQQNAGVAMARNRAFEAARGAYVALCDADDLWHPEKLARQVALLEARGPRIGLVYCWSSVIDAEGRIVDRRGCGVPRHEGDVYAALVLWNFVGNASAPLLRRECLEAAGGFDSGLRGAGAQGCEDLKLYLAVAERWEFALVPAFLVGYRRSPGTMSRQVERMRRSHALVLAEAARRHPELPRRLLRWSRALADLWLAETCVRDGRPLAGLRLLAAALARDPGLVARPLVRARLRPRLRRRARAAWKGVTRRLRGTFRATPRPLFLSMPPDEDVSLPADRDPSEWRRLAFLSSIRVLGRPAGHG